MGTQITTASMTDFEGDFAAWLARVCRDEKTPSSVVAFHIGLFETADGYASYLIGADRYDARDAGWACAESFTPSERYFAIPAATFARWEQVQQAVVEATRAFLQSPEGARSYLAAAEVVTVGFDDGDLKRVR